MSHTKLLILIYVASVIIQGSVGIPCDNVVEPGVCAYDPHTIVLKDIMIDNVSCTFTSPAQNHRPINITDNNYSVDVSYDEVLNFIKYDKTDERKYHDKFMCGEFATMVHNHAERSGIRAHVVAITYLDNRPAHMINGFNTTDKGMIFFDCTGTKYGNECIDKEVVLNVNKESMERSVYSRLRNPGRLVKRFRIV